MTKQIVQLEGLFRRISSSLNPVSVSVSIWSMHATFKLIQYHIETWLILRS